MSQRPLPFRRLHRPALLLPLLLPAAVELASAGPGGRVCGEIDANIAMKERADKLGEDGRVRLLRLHGMNPENHDSVDIALYTSHELTGAEKKEFAARGVRVGHVWIPPVPGHHPTGYHLANMDFSAKAFLEGDKRVLHATSTEFTAEPGNDLAGEIIGSAALHAGNGAAPRTGGGVRIAVADSGFDITHPDFGHIIETFDLTTGFDSSEWSTDVANQVTGHGTHVAGSAAGSGLLSEGLFAGGAPESDLYLYKIGNDEDARATTDVMIASVHRAVEMQCHVYTISYGGFGAYMDGSGAMQQALDHAHHSGVLCFVAAGNNANRSRHATVTVPPRGTSTLEFRFNSPSGDEPWSEPVGIRAIWRAGDPGEDQITVTVPDLEEEEAFALDFDGVSDRETNGQRYLLTPNVPPGTSRIYHLEVHNPATTGEPLRVHFYSVTTHHGTFPDAEERYTITTPADADTAIAVGAWVHRDTWINFEGDERNFGQTRDTMASFSSLGPRIDGVMKPDLVAPGSAVISLNDSDVPAPASTRIAHDGSQDGTGPADYAVNQGTSMATPLAAGAAALLINDAPISFGPPQLRHLLLTTARDLGLPPEAAGAGLIDIEAALVLLKEHPDFTGNWMILH